MPVAHQRHTNRQDSKQALIRVGFVPLIDASPVIVAAELGYFADEGLNVTLEKQIGWGNVRDRLTYGELHASHAPIGMVPASLAGLTHYDEPLTVVMRLGAGGNAITVSQSLADLGDAITAPARWRQRTGRPLALAYVFSVASHHYALRHLLKPAGLDAKRDARLCVLPPVQMATLLQQGTIDGYCAGEPWNTLAIVQNSGAIFRATTELAPDHPEKVLAATRRWLVQNVATAERLVRAILRGCDFCEDVANRSRLTELLARPTYLGIDEAVIAKSLAIDDWLRPGIRRPRFRSFARPTTVPSPASVEWIVREMVRWGQLPESTDVERLGRQSVIQSVYADAISELDTSPIQPAETEPEGLPT